MQSGTLLNESGLRVKQFGISLKQSGMVVKHLLSNGLHCAAARAPRARSKQEV
ncbi:MAG: hypothetical protein HY040_08630 [Planctomycetes bacterium]|nr:hypothetical protein [Planctomycetota bacterium]